jgi:hypothetical protein
VCWGRKRRGRGHRRQGELGREGEALREQETKKQKSFMDNNGGRAHRIRRPRRSREEKRRRPDRQIEGTGTKLSKRRTERYPRIPQTTYESKVIARRSCHWSWNRPELRRAIPSVSDLDWEWGFEFRKELDERILHTHTYIYILLGFKDILFFVIIPFLKLKVISKKTEIVFNIRKYLEGSKNYRKISRHDLTPNELKKYI